MVRNKDGKIVWIETNTIGNVEWKTIPTEEEYRKWEKENEMKKQSKKQAEEIEIEEDDVEVEETDEEEDEEEEEEDEEDEDEEEDEAPKKKSKVSKKNNKKASKKEGKKKESSRPKGKSGKFKTIRHFMESLFAKNKNLTKEEAGKLMAKEFPNSAWVDGTHFPWYKNHIVNHGRFFHMTAPKWAEGLGKTGGKKSDKKKKQTN